VFIVLSVYFVIDPVRKLLDTPSYTEKNTYTHTHTHTHKREKMNTGRDFRANNEEGEG